MRVSLFALLCALGFSLAPAHAFDKFLALGTSSTSGVYYPVGKSICALLNANRIAHKVRCLAYSTGGSVYNIQALVSGELDVAITRSDLAFKAYHGKELFGPIGPNRDLRVIATLYQQPVAVIVRKNSGIATFDRLEGHSITIGNRGSGKREIAETIFGVMGWARSRFSEVLELTAGRAATAFCAGKVDILIESVGIPSRYSDRLTGPCQGRFIALPQQLIDGFKKIGPFFFDDSVPGDMFPNNPADVPTVGIKIVLVTLRRVDPIAIDIVARSIFEGLDKFRNAHPALNRSTAKSMLTKGIDVPFHAGALGYYREKGMLAE